MNTPSLTGWPALVLMLCTLASYCTRRFATKEHFFQTDFGAVCLSLLTAFAGAGAQWATAGALSLNTLTPLLVGALMSALAASNPTAAAPSQGDK